MISRKTIAKAALAAGAIATLAGVVAVPSAASAQGYSYEQCQRDNSNRGVTGAAVGGLAGGVIGNQASARGRHTENTLLGAAVGGLLGAVVGRGNTSCYGSSAYDNRGGYYDNSYNGAYDNRGYDNRGYDNRGYDDRAAYDRYYGEGYYAPPPVAYAPPPVYYAPPVYAPPAVVFSFGSGGRGYGGYGGYGYGGGRGRW